MLPIDVTLLLDVSGSVDGLLLERLKASVRETAALPHGDVEEVFLALT